MIFLTGNTRDFGQTQGSAPTGLSRNLMFVHLRADFGSGQTRVFGQPRVFGQTQGSAPTGFMDYGLPGASNHPGVIVIDFCCFGGFRRLRKPGVVWV